MSTNLQKGYILGIGIQYIYKAGKGKSINLQKGYTLGSESLKIYNVG